MREDPSTLRLLAYTSTPSQPLTKAELVAILARARARNAQLGVTGMLLFTGGSFFQILEGRAEVLAELYAKIAADPRHTSVVKLIAEPLERRSFADWSMGYSEIGRSELATIPGLNDFFLEHSSFAALEPGRARALLAAFRDGKWRRRLG